MNKSERGIPLVLQDIPIKPTITVENYLKWYTLYVVFPDGSVEHLCFPRFDNKEDEIEGEVGFMDHVPNPKAVWKMSERLGYDIDMQSFEMIVGRWFIEVENWDYCSWT